MGFQENLLALAPKAYYSCDDPDTQNDLADSSGNNHDALMTTAGEAVLEQPPARVDTGFSVKASGSPVWEAADHADLDLSAAGTITFWIKRNDAEVLIAGMVLGKGSTSSFETCPYLIRYDSTSGTYSLSLGNNVTSAPFAPIAQAPVGVWQHVAWTWDGSFVTPYSDGVAGTPVAQTITPFNSAASFKIGAVVGTSSPNVNLDEIALFDTVVDIPGLFDTPEPEDPPTGPTITDPTGVELVTLARPLRTEWRHELNHAGSFEILLDRNDVQATAANIAQGNIIRIPVPEIDDDDMIFEGILEIVETVVVSFNEEGGEVIRLAGPGSLALLKDAQLWHVSVLGIDSQPVLERNAWYFTTLNAAANIIRRLVLEAQARTPACIPDVTMTFGQFVDTNANTWTEIAESWEGPIGSNVLAETLKFVDAGEFDVRMDPGFIFNAYRPGEMGVDRSSTTFAANKVRFVKGVNIVDELTHEGHEDEWASHVLYRSADGWDVEVAASFPYRREISIDASNLGSVRAAQRAAMRLLLGDRAQEGKQFAILPPPDNIPDDSLGLYWPGIPGMDRAKFWLGDTVTLHTGTGDTDYDNEAMLVVGITFARDETGALLPPIVELNSPTVGEDADASLPTLPGGGSVGSGSSGVGSVGFHAHDHGVLGGLADDDHEAYETVIDGGGPTRQDHGATGATETVDAANGNMHRLLLDADCTITVSAFANGGIVIKLVQNGTGGWAVTWSGPDFGGADDQPSQGAGDVTFYTIVSDGGNLYGFKAGASSGTALTVENEGTPLATAADTLDFVGPLVTASGAGAEKTITVTGALNDLTDVVITAAAEYDTLRHNGTNWVDDSRRWEPVTDNPGTGPELVWDGDDLVMEWKAY